MQLLSRHFPRFSSRTESALLIGLSAAEVPTVLGSADGLGLALCVLAVGALALRRRLPVAALLATLPAAALGLLLIAPMAAMYHVARAVPRVRTVLAAAVLLGGAGVASWWGSGFGDVLSLETGLFGVLHGLVLAGGPTAVGLLARVHGELARRVAELTEARDREQRLLAETAAARERTRLAREMHDVVSHQVSLISVQAGALETVSGDPRGRELAGAIRELAVTTLDELRLIVGVLRRPPGAPDGPGLRDIPALVEASGLQVTAASAVPPPGFWPDAVQRAAFRTVQEALTNVRKYAPGACVRLRLDAPGDADRLLVEVRNGPPTGTSAALTGGAGPPGGGYGLLGLRERAEQLGGSLSAGPADDGGFVVRAELPRGPAG